VLELFNTLKNLMVLARHTIAAAAGEIGLDVGEREKPPSRGHNP
jgi:hypothetical protein